MKELTKEIMYQAIVDKDTSFEGIFFTAVKTTGIFCRPSCSARKPKIENVEFKLRNSGQLSDNLWGSLDISDSWAKGLKSDP